MIIEKLTRNPWQAAKPSAFRASEAGFLCSRYHYHARKDWEARPPVSEKIQDMFALGNELERWVVRRLEEAGIKVIRSQQRMYDAEMDLSGSIDGMVQLDGKEVAIEIKSTASHFWESVSSFADIIKAGRWYVRWAVQLPLYLYLHNLESGLYIFINKQTGELKEVPVSLEEALPLLYVADDVLKSAKKALGNGKPPEPRPLMPDGQTPCPELCSDCWVRAVGLCPGAAQDEVPQELDMMALAEAAEEARELKEFAKAYEKAMDRVKELMKAVKLEPGKKLEMLAGTAVVRALAYESTSYDVPKEVKEQYKTLKLATRIEVL